VRVCKRPLKRRVSTHRGLHLSFSRRNGKLFRAYRDGDTIYKGIHSYIQARFFPGYKRPKHGDGTNHKGAIRMGISTGRQIATWANNAGVRPSKRTTVFARAFMDMCTTRGITPVAGESLVKHDGLRVATGVDFVGRDRTTKRLVLVEIKCGSNGTWNTSHPSPMATTHMQRYSNTPCTHALIQAAASAFLYEVHHGMPHGRVDVKVVRMHKRTSSMADGVAVETYTVPRDIRDHVRSVMMHDKRQ
jgi:hypothetical protein